MGADPAVQPGGRVSRPCPREGCGNTLHSDDLIVCTGDFHALAGMCRGKKRLGEPEADMIESRGRGLAYRCALCREHHNGNPVAARAEIMTTTRATVRALRDDPRVGWRGVLALVDAWAPNMSERERWHEGLDQRAAFAVA